MHIIITITQLDIITPITPIDIIAMIEIKIQILELKAITAHITEIIALKKY